MQWSQGLHEMGYPKWQLVLCLLAVYLMLYVSLFKGVKSSGILREKISLILLWKGMVVLQEKSFG